MTTKKMGLHLTKILKEMCKRVNADFDSIDFKKRGWYSKKEWAREEEEDFNKWLVEYLSKNIEARKELMPIQSKSKVFLRRFAENFSFNYGWKMK